MFCLNLLKLYEEFIESGWIEVNADCCALCYFPLSIDKAGYAAFRATIEGDTCPKMVLVAMECCH